MNEISLDGYIRDIEFSHDVGNTEYDKAKIIVTGKNGKEDDVYIIRFKRFCNKFKEGDYVTIKGNIRSYSYKDEYGSHVEIYIFTYFDLPNAPNRSTTLDGRICKVGNSGVTKNGVVYTHFIVANNIFTKTSKLNSYIPCTLYGDLADEFIKTYKVGDKIILHGALHSHSFKHKLPSNEIEYRVAHEVIVEDIKLDKN